MAAKSRKRLSKNENKLLKLEKLELKDVFCSICQSILIEPVTLPCYHDFCHRCFNGSIENNALCCPLCRLRIGSWIRTATKQNNLVNNELWSFIKSKFSQEINKKVKGEDINLPEENPLPRLSEPGEIRSEYEAEIKRLRAERLRLEQKHFEETELLIKKIQQEEEEAHKKYLDVLKQDEILAQQIHQENVESSSSYPANIPQTQSQKEGSTTRSKVNTIESYLYKKVTPHVKDSPLQMSSDNPSKDGYTHKVSTVKPINRTSPEMIPSYTRLLKNVIDKKTKGNTKVWNKENGEKEDDQKKTDTTTNQKDVDDADNSKMKSKTAIQSLLVSLPLACTGILQHKFGVTENRNVETSSVDSMRQELCYFKPIEGTTPTSFSANKSLPLRVPGVRATHEVVKEVRPETPPDRDQYLDGLCRLRKLSLAQNLPSAFVVALGMLKVTKECSTKCETSSKCRTKKAPSNSYVVQTLPIKKTNSNKNKQTVHIDGITKLNTETATLRRTRSMGSIKDENETTPKKAKLKDRKVSSERKPYLRSDSKKSSTKKEVDSSPLLSESINNNNVNLAVKNLSSPLKNCDVKKILQEQLRIEKIIEQEKNDFELARKMEAEWNGRRQPRRTAIKRQVTLNYALRPAKKLKV